MTVAAKPAGLHRLEELLSAARSGKPFEDEDLRFLLGLTDDRLIDRLFQAARTARDEHFGRRVFLYGFVYFSTYCRNDCAFCQFRQSNRTLHRHRKSPAEILAAAEKLAEAGVHLIDLTLGEDPHLVGEGADPAGFLMESLQAVKKSTGLPLMISPGVVPSELLNSLARSGADWYACYQETHTRSLFARLRPGQDFDGRWRAKLNARSSGMLIEEGVLSGAGETIEDLIASVAMMRRLDPDQARVMTFVPQPGTPMADVPAPDSLRELLFIAVLRLAFPDRLIPASLDVEGLNGLEPRLNAGANVVTSLVAPGSGLTGVAGMTRDIENSRRMPSAVRPVLDRCGLFPADRADYRAWMKRRWRALNGAKSN
jgi:methylornithine synthase